MPKYYLIDYENVRENGLVGAERLTGEDSIFVFYTKNANKISLDAFCGVSAAIKVLKVPAGKQSLDMHISSMLGYLAGKSPEKSDYIIVSKDKDFDTVIASWNEAGVGVFSKQETIADGLKAAEPVPEAKPAEQPTVADTVEEPKKAAPKKPVEKKKAKESPAAETGAADDRTVLNNRIIKLLGDAGLEGNLPNTVASVVMSNVKKQNKKQAVYLELIKKFGQQEGLKYYKLVKGSI